MSGSYQKVKVILLHDMNGVGVGEEEPTYFFFGGEACRRAKHWNWSSGPNILLPTL